MAAGDDRICEQVAARGPFRLLRRFNGGSQHQRRVSEEGSSSLKRRNLSCGSRIAIGSRGSFFSTARTNGRAVTLCEKKRLQGKSNKLFFPIKASSTQYE